MSDPRAEAGGPKPVTLRMRILALALSFGLTVLAMIAAAFPYIGTPGPLTNIFKKPAGLSDLFPDETPLQQAGSTEIGLSKNAFAFSDGTDTNGDGYSVMHRPASKQSPKKKAKKKKIRTKRKAAKKRRKKSVTKSRSLRPQPAQVPEDFDPYLYVLDVSEDDQVVFLDLRTDEEGPTIVLTDGLDVPLTDPQDMDMPDDGSFLAVANWGFRFQDAFAPPHITIIDIDQQRIVDRILLPEGRLTRGIAVTPDGRFAYVSAFDLEEGATRPSASWILVVDLAGRRVIREIRIPDGPNGATEPGKVVMTPDGALVFTPCLRIGPTGSLCVVDTQTNTFSTVITDRSLAQVDDIVMHPSGSRIYVAPAQNFPGDITMRGIAVIDTSSAQIINMIPIDPNARNRIGMCISPDGQYLVYTNPDINALLEIKTETNQIVFQTEFDLFGSDNCIVAPLPPELHEQ